MTERQCETLSVEPQQNLFLSALGTRYGSTTYLPSLHAPKGGLSSSISARESSVNERVSFKYQYWSTQKHRYEVTGSIMNQNGAFKENSFYHVR